MAALAAAAVIVVAGLLAFLLPSAPGPTKQPDLKQGVELHILTRHDTTIQFVYERAFLNSSLAKRFNITSLRWDSVAAPFWEKLIAAGDEDVAWGGGPTLFDVLTQQGAFAPIDHPVALAEVNKIPDTFQGVRLKRVEAGKPSWVAAAISSFGIVVNKPYLERNKLPVPRDWVDLAGPDYAKTLPVPALSMADPLGSTSHTRIYEIILQAHAWDTGWSMMTRLAANGKILGGSTDALTEITSSNVGAGPAIDFYGYSAHNDNPNIDYVLPASTIVNGDPIALVKTSKNAAAAQAFIAYVLSVEGQLNWLDPRINRLPVREEIFDTPRGRQRSDIAAAFRAAKTSIPVNFSDDLALSYEFAMQNYFKAALIDKHDQLVDAWKALVDRFRAGRLTKEQFDKLALELGKPLTITLAGQRQEFTQGYAQSINTKLDKDEAFKTQFWEAVRAAAEQRYQQIKKQATS